MGVSTLNTEVDYPGDGALTNFGITFQFITTKAEAQIDVYNVTIDGDGFEVETLQTLGVDYEFTYPAPGPPTVVDPTSITYLIAPPPLLTTVRIKRDISLQQIYDYLNTGRFLAEKHEEGMDTLLMMIQQVNTIASEALTIAGGAAIPPFVADALLAANATADGFQWIAQSALGITGALPLPTDGVFGGPNGPIAGVAEDDLVQDAFDKVETLLGLLVPAPPKPVSSVVLAVTSSYAALAETTGTSHPAVINDTTPIITEGVASVLADAFRNAATGILSAEVDAIETGTITLTAGDDTGTNGELEIVDDFDPYASITGQLGIWEGLTARIQPAALSVGVHTAQLKHTETGDSNLLSFYIDDAITPGVNTIALDASGASTSYKSGVPGVASGQNVNVTFNVTGAVKTHYNATRIARATCPQTSSVNDALPGSPPAASAVVAADIDIVVASGAYSEDIVVTALGYNSAGTSASGTASNSIRVDTVGTETRVISGTGQYPASGYGGAFVAATSIATASNFELQYLNGKFKDPPAVNYSSLTPAGPNYSSLSYDSYGTMRWATFSLGSITAQTSVSFAINSSSGFGASALVSGIDLYVRVDGGAPTTGWVDANAAYPGVGNPSADGDAALNVGSSSATSKVVTFGAAVKTGTVYVRIGLPSGSTKTFGSIS